MVINTVPPPKRKPQTVYLGPAPLPHGWYQPETWEFDALQGTRDPLIIEGILETKQALGECFDPVWVRRSLERLFMLPPIPENITIER